MRISFAGIVACAALAGCTTIPSERQAAAPVEVTLIAFNDFHGNLEPPRRSIQAPGGTAGETVQVPAGGVAYLASAIASLRKTSPNNLVLSAGDMVGASPLVSNLFLDEPTIAAMNLIRIDFNALGNHEFDHGRAELLRLADGGCERHTGRDPCAVDAAFDGADFGFLAANTITETGKPLFPAYAIRSFGSGTRRVDVAVIGMTLKDTPSVVTPAGVAGLTFADEADTANALIPRLKAEGADVIVVLIHQGGSTKGNYTETSCDGLEGDIVPILQRLSPAVDVIISGHTHRSYICDYGQIDPGRPFLLTSAGLHGTLLTEIKLAVDPRSGRVISRQAENHIVQGEGFPGANGAVEPTALYPGYPPDPAVASLVARYVAAAEPRAARVIGRMTGPSPNDPAPSRETVLGNLIADAQLAATRAPDRGGSRLAFMNQGGVRAAIVPAADGSVTFGQLFAAQPFGNSLVTKSMTGRQIRALLEQQFASGRNSVESPNMLLPSANFRYAYDLSRPAGQRIIDPRLDGAPLGDAAVYRVTMNSFLATGGDNFTLFAEGKDQVGGPQDLDAIEEYFAQNQPLAPPATDRIEDRTPR